MDFQLKKTAGTYATRRSSEQHHDKISLNSRWNRSSMSTLLFVSDLSNKYKKSREMCIKNGNMGGVIITELSIVGETYTQAHYWLTFA